MGEKEAKRKLLKDRERLSQIKIRLLKIAERLDGIIDDPERILKKL
ncbi:hypothetical protein HY604_01305 [Candidatus Peregrinibacteria bacterium]|nr:hypothetical protein [Candidatus Peregrinibacteria bacterium]